MFRTLPVLVLLAACAPSDLAAEPVGGAALDDESNRTAHSMQWDDLSIPGDAVLEFTYVPVHDGMPADRFSVEASGGWGDVSLSVFPSAGAANDGCITDMDVVPDVCAFGQGEWHSEVLSTTYIIRLDAGQGGVGGLSLLVTEHSIDDDLPEPPTTLPPGYPAWAEVWDNLSGPADGAVPVDYYIDVPAGAVIVAADLLQGTGDADLELYNPAGGLVTSSRNGAGTTDSVQVYDPESGIWMARVIGYTDYSDAQLITWARTD